MIRTTTRLSYANGYLDLGMVDEASEELNAIPEKDRLNDDVLVIRSRFYLETKNWEIMAAVSEQLIEQNPEIPYAWINWAYALREMDKNADAKSIAIRGLAIHPAEATLWYNLACYCSLLGELEEASEHLEKAVGIDGEFKQEALDDPDLAKLRDWLK